jgi:signal transduction histidine kinase
MSNILIVDDDDQSLYLLEAILSGHGHRVRTARNGAEALATARQWRPDLAVSDILMPKMDGFTLCQEWKRDEQLREVPLIFYTATYTDPKDEQLALSLGADLFVVKPKEPDDFLKIIDGVMDRDGAARPAARPRAAEEVNLREYNEALIRKLEAKLVELEESRRALAAGEARFQAFMDHCPALAFVKDAGGRYVYANRAWENQFSPPRPDWAGLTDFDLFPADTARLFQASDRECLRSGSPLQFREAAQVACGEGRHWLTVKFPLPAAPGGPAGHVGGMALDVTAQARLEGHLHQAQKMDAIGRMAGGVSHDFNNLLMIITAHADLLQLTAGLPAEAREHVELIARACQQGAHLAQQLLLVSRASGVTPSPVALDDAVRAMAPMLRSAVGRDVELAVATAAGAARVSLGPGQIEQVLLNLALNARDAMPAGGRLTVATAAEGGLVRLVVSDTGSGMTPEVMDHLFEPFFTTKEPGRGTGLGLAVVYGIVTQAGGQIDVASEPGRGATFTIRLPAALAEPPADP